MSWWKRAITSAPPAPPAVAACTGSSWSAKLSHWGAWFGHASKSTRSNSIWCSTRLSGDMTTRPSTHAPMMPGPAWSRLCATGCDTLLRSAARSMKRQRHEITARVCVNSWCVTQRAAARRSCPKEPGDAAPASPARAKRVSGEKTRTRCTISKKSLRSCGSGSADSPVETPEGLGGGVQLRVWIGCCPVRTAAHERLITRERAVLSASHTCGTAGCPPPPGAAAGVWRLGPCTSTVTLMSVSAPSARVAANAWVARSSTCGS
mmetsp:Transcript_19795/g.53339  ORF Transcript_19795/g.53339 Transcript_19795/m.53339 type:complete len:263 (-) Transcript_19795:724-1512(-)